MLRCQGGDFGTLLGEVLSSQPSWEISVQPAECVPRNPELPGLIGNIIIQNDIDYNSPGCDSVQQHCDGKGMWITLSPSEGYVAGKEGTNNQCVLEDLQDTQRNEKSKAQNTAQKGK